MINLIHHPLFTDALDKVERTIAAGQDGSSVSCLVVDGPSGSGKSMLQQYLESRYERRRTTSGLEVPFARIPMPANPTIKSLAAGIVSEVGDGIPVRGSEAACTQWAIQQLINVKNRVLVFDDVQHVVDHCTRRDQGRITDWLKDVIEQTRAALILCGLPRVHQLVMLNDQLSRRFNETAHLRRLFWENEDDREIFLDLLSSIEAHMAEFDMPQLDSDELAFRMYAATGGLLGYLVKLMEEAERIARRDGSMAITVDTLGQAHAFTVYRKTPALEHPFDLDIDLEPGPEVLARVQTTGLEGEIDSTADMIAGQAR